MRLLLVNFELDRNSPVLAWQAQVARRLGDRLEFIMALTERQGDFEPGPNMLVEQIPRRVSSWPGKALSVMQLNAHVAALCRQHRISVCFVHMAHRWAFLLFPALWFMRVPTLLWYAHGTVTTGLKLAHACAALVVTSSREGFRIPSAKVRVIGQGVDTEVFTPVSKTGERTEILYIGRVSRRKRIKLMLDVMACLRDRRPDLPLVLRIVGPVLTPDDEKYLHELRDDLSRLNLNDRVLFTGALPPSALPPLYASAFVHLNVSNTGSMDKTVLESLSMGCPVLTSNESFLELLRHHPECIIENEAPDAIADRVLAFYDTQDQIDGDALRRLIVGRHDVSSYVERIIETLQELDRARG